jgi:hypothetical protein
MAKAKLTGEEAMLRKLRKLERTYPDKMELAITVEAELIMTRSKSSFVPVRLGALRTSGHVEKAERVGRIVLVRLVYGGVSAPYAIIQHERLDFQHKVGEAKYLERPLNQAVPGMAKRMARTLDLDRVRL